MYVQSFQLLFVTVSMLLMSAAVMTLFGASRPVYRGYWWWTSAQWLLALGVGACALQDHYPSTAVLANVLMLQWPVAVAAGLRRFYARHALWVPPWVDGLLLGLACTGWLVAWVWYDAAMTSLVFSAAAAALYAYALALLFGLKDFRKNPTLQVLALTHAVAAGLMTLRAIGAGGHAVPQIASPEFGMVCSLVGIMSALSLVYLSLVLTQERTEMRLRFSKRRLRYLADIDTLTKVPNRRRFHELATRILASSTPGDSALMMFDIDHFKRINDLLGHAVGDEALRQVGHCTRDTLRELDVAGRLGGDEFAVLLPETTVEEAMTVASRIVTRLEHRQVAPRIARLSLSFGVVQMQEGESIADALRRADQALYEAKRQGRSRAVIATGAEEQPVFSTSQPLGLTTQ